MEASSMPRNGQYEKEMRLKKAMLWQTVMDQCTDVDTFGVTGVAGSSSKPREHPGHLPHLPSHGGSSRGGQSNVSTGRCGSRASSRCSSTYSRDSSARSVQSSRCPSISSSRACSTRSGATSTVRSRDSAPGRHDIKRLPWDVVECDDDKAPEVEEVEVRTKMPSLPPMESSMIPPKIGVAWQDPQLEQLDKCRLGFSAGSKVSSIAKRDIWDFTASDSHAPSHVSDEDSTLNDIFGDRSFDFNAFDDLPKDPFDEPADLWGSGFTTPTPPTGARKTPSAPRPPGRKLPPVLSEAADATSTVVSNDSTGHREVLPVPLEASGAASSADSKDILAFASSGHTEGSAAVPPIKEAWGGPQQPRAPPPANRFMRPGMKPQIVSTTTDSSEARTKLSL
mmetsp:Transcript_90358/g.234327  ORF Transcript_90358/g.234327 Transcript_90358/m.234327 type:complete len:394 (-) Transcript_90358:532-1713(-)